MANAEGKAFHVVGKRGRVVRLFERERADGPPLVYLGWYDAEAKRPRRRSLGLTIRKHGRKDAKLRDEAIAKAEAWQKAWADGAPAPMPPEEWEPPKAATPAPVAAPAAESVPEPASRAPARTLGWLVDRVYGPSIRGLSLSERTALRGRAVDLSEEGEQPAYTTYAQQSVLRRDAADLLLDALGKNTRLADLTSAHVDAIFASCRVGAIEGGFSRACLMAETLRHALNWARRRHGPVEVPLVQLLDSGWRKEREAGWEAATGARLRSDDEQPRHTAAEVSNLFAAAVRGLAPERVSVALILGAPARLGAFASKLRRSDIELDFSGARYGRMKVRGTLRKQGTVYFLTKRERACLDRWLAGPLALLETAYLANPRKADYYVLPSGRRNAAGQYVRGKRAVSPSRLTDEFNQLERAAGVDHVNERNWYGVRRALTDIHARLAPKAGVTDRLVLDTLTGHVPEGMREKVYRSRFGHPILRQARKLRARAFERLLARAPEVLPTATVVAPRLLYREANPGDGGNAARKRRRQEARELKTKLAAHRAPRALSPAEQLLADVGRRAAAG